MANIDTNMFKAQIVICIDDIFVTLCGLCLFSGRQYSLEADFMEVFSKY